MSIVAMEHLQFGWASANVMTLLRVAQFKAMLRQDSAWIPLEYHVLLIHFLTIVRYFDDDSHNVSVVIVRIADIWL